MWSRIAFLSSIYAIISGTSLSGSLSRILAETRDGYTRVDSMFSLPLAPLFDGGYLPLSDEDLYESVGDVLLNTDRDSVASYVSYLSPLDRERIRGLCHEETRDHTLGRLAALKLEIVDQLNASDKLTFMDIVYRFDQLSQIVREYQYRRGNQRYPYIRPDLFNKYVELFVKILAPLVEQADDDLSSHRIDRLYSHFREECKRVLASTNGNFNGMIGILARVRYLLEQMWNNGSVKAHLTGLFEKVLLEETKLRRNGT
jgi:hypothetical protein